MINIVSVFMRSMRSFCHPKIILISFLPMACAIIIWFVIGFTFWDYFYAATDYLFTDILGLTDKGDTVWVALGFTTFTVISAFALVPLVFLTASILASFFMMPIVLKHLVQTEYQKIEKNGVNGFIGSIRNVIFATFLFLVLWTILIPLWLLAGPLVPLLIWLFAGWLHQKIYCYDALCDYATIGEIEKISKENRRSLFSLGLICSGFYIIPFVNLLAPTFMALVFSHYCLNELIRNRIENNQLNSF